MLRIGYVPSDFGRGLIIPIPKKSNITKFTKIKDYRGITISPVISKIFENCILELAKDLFVSSDLQFGFKKNRGCRDALFTFAETVDYFVANNSTVNICAVDLSRAFDEVKHHVLFSKLMNKKFPVWLIQILYEWYGKCFCSVKWGNAFSRIFKITQGVRQGGVLSPLLYALYVDDALCKLNQMDFGCYVSGLMISALMYADDVILIAPSVVALQKLISLCQSEFEDLYLHFNVTKCAAMRVGPRYKSVCSTLVVAGGVSISWVSEIKYLGVVISQGLFLKVNVHYNKVKFFNSFNSLYAKLGNQYSIDTLIHLLNTNCLSTLLYGLEAFNLTKSNFNDLQFPLNRAYIKMFHVNNTESIKWCQLYMQQLPIDMCCEINKLVYWKYSGENRL